MIANVDLMPKHPLCFILRFHFAVSKCNTYSVLYEYHPNYVKWHERKMAWTLNCRS